MFSIAYDDQEVLLDEGQWTIGSDADQWIRLPGPLVASKHVIIEIAGQNATVKLLAVAYGARLRRGADEIKLGSEPHQLSPGDVLIVGLSELRFDRYALVESAPEVDEPSIQSLPPLPPLPPEDIQPLRETSPRNFSWSSSKYLAYLPAVYGEVRGLDDRTELEPALDLGIPKRFQNSNNESFRREPFLGRWLRGFEDVWEPNEHRVDHLALYFDPHTCPESFLPYLGGWLGLPLPPGLQPGRLRPLVCRATELIDRRGTIEALELALLLYAGVHARVQEFENRAEVTVLSTGSWDRELIQWIFDRFVPAHVVCRIMG